MANNNIINTIFGINPNVTAAATNYTVASGAMTSGVGGTGYYTFNNYPTDADVLGKNLSIDGDANINGDLTIKGKSINDRLDLIEKRLAILHPNKELEEKWERLKSLGDMYRELEQEIIEKEHIWATLKK